MKNNHNIILLSLRKYQISYQNIILRHSTNTTIKSTSSSSLSSSVYYRRVSNLPQCNSFITVTNYSWRNKFILSALLIKLSSGNYCYYNTLNNSDLLSLLSKRNNFSINQRNFSTLSSSSLLSKNCLNRTKFQLIGNCCNEKQNFCSDKMIKKCEFQRLPVDVVPTHYNLELNPDLVKCEFTGKVSVKVKVSASSNNDDFFLYIYVKR